MGYNVGDIVVVMVPGTVTKFKGRVVAGGEPDKPMIQLETTGLFNGKILGPVDYIVDLRGTEKLRAANEKKQ